MVKLFLNVTIDEFIANTDSIIEIYLNNHFIGCLGSNIRNINRSVVIASNDSTIVIKRKYMKPEFSKKARLIKIIKCNLFGFDGGFNNKTIRMSL